MPTVACALGTADGSMTDVLNSLSALSADTTRDILSPAVKLTPGNRLKGEIAKQAVLFPTAKILLPALTNPALAFTATVFAFVIGGKFLAQASGGDGMADLAKKVLKEVTGMIKHNNARVQHAHNQGYLQDLAEDLTWVLPMLCKESGEEMEGMWLTYFVILSHDLGTRQSELFGPACVRDMTVGDTVSKECESIMQGKVDAVGDTTLIIGTLYAVLHLNVLSEIGRIEPHYAPDIAERIVNIGMRYLRLLRHLYARYRNARLSSIANSDIKVECHADMDYPFEGFPTCEGIKIYTSGGWDKYSSTDIILSPPCNEQHTRIEWDKDHHPKWIRNGYFEMDGCAEYNTPEINRAPILQACVDDYRKQVRLALAAIAERINALAAMVNAANELAGVADWHNTLLYEPLAA